MIFLPFALATAITLLVVWCAVKVASDSDLAIELAKRNDRCGAVDADRVCLRPANHQGEHAWESVSRVVPIN